jgi:1,6-anhydro-N-acetylmuramate kinase
MHPSNWPPVAELRAADRKIGGAGPAPGGAPHHEAVLTARTETQS